MKIPIFDSDSLQDLRVAVLEWLNSCPQIVLARLLQPDLIIIAPHLTKFATCLRHHCTSSALRSVLYHQPLCTHSSRRSTQVVVVTIYTLPACDEESLLELLSFSNHTKILVNRGNRRLEQTKFEPQRVAHAWQAI